MYGRQRRPSSFRRKATTFRSRFRGRSRTGVSRSRSSRSLGFRSRFARTFRRRRGLTSKAAQPLWFKIALRQHAPSDVAATQGTRVLSPATSLNTQAFFTMWKGRTIQDIQNALDVISATAGSNSGTSAATNSLKMYMFDHVVDHCWRNNGQNVDIELQFYQLTPRNSMPSFVAGTSVSAATISPPSTYNYADCILASPTLMTTGMSDESALIAAGTQITQADVSATPFMCSPLCGMFKIKRFKVKGPSGFKSIQRLTGGQSCIASVSNRKPFLVNYNKFMLTSSPAKKLSETWEVLRSTPLILCYVRGTCAHDTANHATIRTSQGSVDYLVKRHWKLLEVEKQCTAGVRTMLPYTAVGAIGTGVEQTEIMDGVEHGVAPDQ